MPQIQSAAAALRAAGIRPTLGRIAAWEMLHAAPEPLSFYDLQRQAFQRLQGVPVNTLYNSLKSLEEKGLVRRIRVDGRNHAYFSLVTNKQHCQCLTCDRCGQQLWLEDKGVREAVERLCHRRGLALATYQVNVQAHCHKCGNSAVDASTSRSTPRSSHAKCGKDLSLQPRFLEESGA